MLVVVKKFEFRKIIYTSLFFFCFNFIFADNEAPDPGGGSVGTTNSSNYNWNGSVTYSWDFSSVASSKSAGTDFDTWNISGLTLNTGDTTSLTINIDDIIASSTFSETNGDDLQANGYLFLDVLKVSSTTSGGLSKLDSVTFSGDHTGQGTWKAYYDDSGMSLGYTANYTAAPEPSTYIMVSGLVFLPVLRYWRRFRNKA
jgi:hypothetical protein